MHIKLYGPLREVVPVVDLELSEPCSVDQALSRLCALYPRLAPLMYQDNTLASHFVVLVNGSNIWSGDGLGTLVSDQDALSVVYPIEGG